MAEQTSKDIDSIIVRTTQNYIREAYEAKRDRMRLNRDNYDIFHHRQDYSHKRPGQSQEFLPKQQMAVEQMSNFVTQGLVDMGQWFSVDKGLGVEKQLINSKDVYYLLQRQLDKTKFLPFVNDSIKTGALASLMIAKVHGKTVPQVEYHTESQITEDGIRSSKLFRDQKNVWQLYVELIRPEDFFPDPTGSNLYICQNMWLDKSAAMAMAEGPDALYDLEKIKMDKITKAPVDKKFIVFIESSKFTFLDLDHIDGEWKFQKWPTNSGANAGEVIRKKVYTIPFEKRIEIFF